MTNRLRIAVIGAGIAGITAAYLLAKRHDVTLIERNVYVGGHTNTIMVNDPNRRDVPVDTGFIICNAATYPLFYRLLNEWGVSLRDTEMSFGYHCNQTGLAYVGPEIGRFMRRPGNLLNQRFVRMLFERRRFNAQALGDLRDHRIGDVSLGEYLDRQRASTYFVQHYLLPLAAAVWSSPDADMLRFPAETFIRFFANHGMLAQRDRPTWQTVVGGSQSYVRHFRERFQGKILTNAAVRAVRRGENAVDVQLADSSMTFDRVVLATHADESLAMLSDATPDEARRLSAWTYHRNSVLLHTDARILPRDRRLWASWNYRRIKNAANSRPVAATYYMNKLQGLTGVRDYFVTLNANSHIEPSTIIYSVEYSHPAYTQRSIAAQCDVRQHNGERGTYFCGSYMGYGFHEDAVASAVDVASKMGASL